MPTPYTLKEGEVRVPVSGKLSPHCPPDGCTVILQRHLESIKDKYLFWDPRGYVIIKTHETDGSIKNMNLHRYILKVLEGRSIPPKHVVHHIDHNRFRNTLDNLEITTYAHNSAARPKQGGASSAFRGVSWHKRSRKWQATISVNKALAYLGFHDCEQGAARAYDIAFVAVHGSANGTNKLLTEDEVNDILCDRDQYKPKVKDKAKECHVDSQHAHTSGRSRHCCHSRSHSENPRPCSCIG